MKKAFSILLLLFMNVMFSQSLDFNLDFEKHSKSDVLPTDWFKWGDYNLKIDSTTTVSGKNAVFIDSENGDSFGCIAHKLPANFKGKKITIEGYIKIENVTEGFAGLLIRIDKNKQAVAFGNMQDQNLVGTKDWEKYTLTLDFVESADNIYIGGILNGKGKAWFDDFKVTIDGKPIESLKQIERELSVVEKDNEFDSGSKFKITNLNEIQKRNLFILGKVWGFVKYYHPEIAKGNISWDYELFRILPKISDTDFDAELVNWINKLGAFNAATKKLPNEEEIKLLPNTSWISDTTLISKELSILLQKVDIADKSSSNYYIDFYKGIGNPDFKNEKVYDKMEYTDTGIKLLALFRYWNMIEYFFPSRHLMDENWDTVLKKFIPQMIETKDQKEYTLTLLELIGKVQDTHANIWGSNKSLDEFFGKNIVPIQIKFIENKAVVTKLQEEFKGTNVKVGDIITSVNGIKIEDWIAKNSKYFPASNFPTQLRDIAKKILRSNETSIHVSVESKSGIKELDLETITYKYFKEEEPISHKIINETIGYIYPGNLKTGEIDEIMPNFLDKKGLIVDLRCYPSDFIVFSLNKYLLEDRREFVKFTFGSLKNPGLFTYGKELSVGKKNKDNFKGKIIILINEVTQSQAEYTTMALRVSENAIVLGSTTAGADGNVSSILLPGNIFTYISGIGVLYPDGKETQRVGIIPDIEVEPTIQGIIEGRDEVLEKAIELINKK